MDFRGYRRSPPQGNNFNEWVKHAALATQDPCGDFVKDARTDDNLPPIISLKQLKEYVSCSPGSCPEAVEAAGEAWTRFQKWHRKKGDF